MWWIVGEVVGGLWAKYVDVFGWIVGEVVGGLWVNYTDVFGWIVGEVVGGLWWRYGWWALSLRFNMAVVGLFWTSGD